jgi:hypothetical protein
MVTHGTRCVGPIVMRLKSPAASLCAAASKKASTSLAIVLTGASYSEASKPVSSSIVRGRSGKAQRRLPTSSRPKYVFPLRSIITVRPPSAAIAIPSRRRNSVSPLRRSHRDMDRIRVTRKVAFFARGLSRPRNYLSPHFKRYHRHSCRERSQRVRIKSRHLSTRIRQPWLPAVAFLRGLNAPYVRLSPWIRR